MADLQTISKQERDRFLDELDRETRRWTQSERKRIEKESEFLKRVLKARAGTGKVTTSNIERTSKLTADNINQLLGVRAANKKKE